MYEFVYIFLILLDLLVLDASFGTPSRPHVLRPALCHRQLWTSAKELLFLRLFHHTFGTHPEQPLPTGYKGIPFIVGQGDFLGCALGVCCNFRGLLLLLLLLLSLWALPINTYKSGKEVKVFRKGLINSSCKLSSLFEETHINILVIVVKELSTIYSNSSEPYM